MRKIEWDPVNLYQNLQGLQILNHPLVLNQLQALALVLHQALALVLDLDPPLGLLLLQLLDKQVVAETGTDPG